MAREPTFEETVRCQLNEQSAGSRTGQTPRSRRAISISPAICAAPVTSCALLGGWSDYFSHGTLASVYRAVDDHVYDRVRNFLRKRHKAPGRGTKRFSRENVYEELGMLRLCRGREGSRRVPYDEASRKAGCGKSARPV